MSRVLHQMPAPAGRVAARRGEASYQAISDETLIPHHGPEGAGRDLLAQALAKENMQRAWERVKANKGAAGVDGLDIAQSGQHLKHAWPTIKQQLMEGTYRPQPVRRVGIPKPDGTEREHRLRKRVNDTGVIRLLRAYLNAGIMDGGVVVERAEGTPQGGPLSPLLANVLLDEVDRELERRGHRFARYADDCNVMCTCAARRQASE